MFLKILLLVVAQLRLSASAPSGIPTCHYICPYQDHTSQNVTVHYPRNDSLFFCRYSLGAGDTARYCAYDYETGVLVVGSEDGACLVDASYHCTYPPRKRANIVELLSGHLARRAAVPEAPNSHSLYKRACLRIQNTKREPARRSVSDFDDMED